MAIKVTLFETKWSNKSSGFLQSFNFSLPQLKYSQLLYLEKNQGQSSYINCFWEFFFSHFLGDSLFSHVLQYNLLWKKKCKPSHNSLHTKPASHTVIRVDGCLSLSAFAILVRNSKVCGGREWQPDQTIYYI